MPRRRRAEVREILADPIYNSTLCEKFINSMMWDGKKGTAQRIFYLAMTKLGDRANDEPLKVFKKAVENAKPLLPKNVEYKTNAYEVAEGVDALIIMTEWTEHYRVAKKRIY